MQRIEKKHPQPTRWFHWINAPVLAVMIWSGLLIYWANDVYRIGYGETTLFHFFPDGFYTIGTNVKQILARTTFFHFIPDGFYATFNIERRLAEGMAWHFLFMWLFALNGLAYVLYTIFSGEWRYLVPGRSSFREAIQVVLHDLHLSKVEPPRRKFNAAQQFAYTGVVFMGACSLLTGLAIYKPVQFAWLTWLLGGYEMARWEHFWLVIGYVLFFLIHISQVIRAGWNNFRAMVTGYEVVPAEEQVHA